VYTLTIVFAFLGVHVANMTYHYDILVRGTLGISVIYLLFRVFWSSKKDDPIEDYSILSKNIRHFAFTFIGGIIFYWAVQQAIEMVVFYFKK